MKFCVAQGATAVIYSQKMWWKRYREVKMLLILHPHVSSAHVSERVQPTANTCQAWHIFPMSQTGDLFAKAKTVCQTLNVTFFIRIFLILSLLTPQQGVLAASISETISLLISYKYV